jgi:hypothetical protein
VNGSDRQAAKVCDYASPQVLSETHRVLGLLWIASGLVRQISLPANVRVLH